MTHLSQKTYCYDTKEGQMGVEPVVWVKAHENGFLAISFQFIESIFLKDSAH